MKSCDLLIVGGGVVGLTAAHEAARRKLDIVLVEKEPQLGFHTSGRNSGVLHAGLYYATDSLKARLCLSGNRLLREYQQKTGFAFRPCGKVVVAPRVEDVPELDRLYERARENGVRVERIDEKRLAEIEPAARTVQRAIWSPDTAAFDPADVMRHLEADARRAGIAIYKSSPLERVDAERGIARAGGQDIRFGHLLNAAGLHADRVAHRMGVGKNYRILPFKGLYKRLRDGSPAAALVRGLIYAVPDRRFPFLGAQVMRTVAGDVIAGPTAIPALGRENYRFLSGLEAADAWAISRDLARMIWSDRNGLRGFVLSEFTRYAPGGFLHAVRRLVPGVEPADLEPYERVGIRAQLVDARTLELVTDFVVEDGPRSTHVLNAVSPAFTSSFAFAKLLLDRIEGRTNEVAA